jgi:hypothetical protein
MKGKGEYFIDPCHALQYQLEKKRWEFLNPYTISNSDQSGLTRMQPFLLLAQQPPFFLRP